MVKAQTTQIASRVPNEIVEFIDADIRRNAFVNRADWIQCACREFIKIRREELKLQSDIDSGPLGGGGQPVVNTPFKKFFPSLTSVIFCSDDC